MAPSSELTLRVSSAWSELIRVNQTVEQFLEALGVAEDDTARLTMVACELVENAIKYGNVRKGREDVGLTLKLAANSGSDGSRN